ncbi:hypothetical protein BV22DRAFT_131733 [Leucogyrophana mollusca]|uniref:Uncharacterized protein n=1 Tax=Leucogyrophana mollusca TaxID=85980 RepID=A0ACB8BTU2_9AGAM|nr:hypothetical protein BV22DRAFT_131733 [Leucogyrophana mollusca]
MARHGKKYYAVRVGRQGPRVYETWAECSANVSRWPSAVHKSFTSRSAAEDWIRSPTHSVTPSSSASMPPSDTSERVVLPGSSKLIPLQAKTSKPSFQEEDYIPLDVDAPEPLQTGVDLSNEQRMVLEMVQRGENVFFTGSAGTGKSVLLREIIRLRGGRGSKALAITASTGIASVNIGGATVHSWAGIGLGQEDAKKLAGKFLGQSKFHTVRDRWRGVKSLVLDETCTL